MSTSTGYVIFTDLDGTLLDHDTYSHADADATLTKLRRVGIPVIPTTSKTAAELRVIRQALTLDGPYIVENGAAVHVPNGFLRHKPLNTQWQGDCWVRQFTSHRQYWINVLQQLQQSFPDAFTTFSAMSIEQICQSTGLTQEQASLAAQRQYGEPVLWLADDASKSRFIEQVRQKGATPLQGGRFLHVSGDCSKGMALNWLMAEIRRQCPDREWQSIALGDSGNDIAMLEAADYAVRILSPAHSPPEINKNEGVYTSTLHGPAGWAEVIEQLLQDRI